MRMILMDSLEVQVCLLGYVRRNRKMINLVMIMLHIFALLFFIPALLVTIPVHLALAKLMWWRTPPWWYTELILFHKLCCQFRGWPLSGIRTSGYPDCEEREYPRIQWVFAYRFNHYLKSKAYCKFVCRVFYDWLYSATTQNKGNWWISSYMVSE